MADNYVFVYGSLMAGFNLHSVLQTANFIGCAKTPGRLVSLGTYPGLVDGDGTVSGEVYRLGDSPEVLRWIDEVERFDANDLKNSLYMRVLRHVLLEDGTDMVAWVYVYNKDVGNNSVIECGDWRAHMGQPR